MVGGVLYVTVKEAVQVDSLVAPSLTCSVTVVRPRPTRVPTVGVCVIESGVEPLQSVATTPLVKLGTAAWQTQLAIACLLGAHVVMVGGVLSVTVKVAVQVDSLVAPSLTCSVTVVRPKIGRASCRERGVIASGVEPLKYVATTPLVKSGTGAWQTPLAKAR